MATPLTAAEQALDVLRNGINSAEVWHDGEVTDTDLHVTLRLCDARALLAERDDLAAQLAALRVQASNLTNQVEHREAQLAEARQAIGLATTAVPEMVIDASNPLGMMQTVVAKLAEARGIAWRLAVWARIGAAWCASEAQPRANADVAAFDALHWPDPPREGT